MPSAPFTRKTSFAAAFDYSPDAAVVFRCLLSTDAAAQAHAACVQTCSPRQALPPRAHLPMPRRRLVMRETPFAPDFRTCQPLPTRHKDMFARRRAQRYRQVMRRGGARCSRRRRAMSPKLMLFSAPRWRARLCAPRCRVAHANAYRCG